MNSYSLLKKCSGFTMKTMKSYYFNYNREYLRIQKWSKYVYEWKYIFQLNSHPSETDDRKIHRKRCNSKSEIY